MNLPTLSRYLAVAALALVLGGCGIQQVQSNSPTAVPTKPVPTPTAVPTISVQGGTVAARVNGVAIPMSEFKRFLNASVQISSQNGSPSSASVAAANTVSQLEQYVIIRQYAAQHGFTITPQALNHQLQSQITNAGGRSTFESRIRGLGFNDADVRYITETEMLATKVRTKVTPAQKTGLIATAKHILISPKPTVTACVHKALTISQARTLALQLLDQIQTGKKTFASVARTCSADTASAKTGGVLQDSTNPGSTLLYHVGGFVPVFENAVFHGPVGRLQLIHSRFGYHIVEVMSRHTGTYPSNQRIAAQTFAFQTWVNNRLNHGRVHVFEKVK